MSDDEFYMIIYDRYAEEILDRRLVGDQIEYLVLWRSRKKLFEPYKSWEAQTMIQEDYNLNKLLDSYWEKQFKNKK